MVDLPRVWWSRLVWCPLEMPKGLEDSRYLSWFIWVSPFNSLGDVLRSSAWTLTGQATPSPYDQVLMASISNTYADDLELYPVHICRDSFWQTVLARPSHGTTVTKSSSAPSSTATRTTTSSSYSSLSPSQCNSASSSPLVYKNSSSSSVNPFPFSHWLYIYIYT